MRGIKRMSNASGLIVALLGGMALGAFFFGGLRWTVQRGLQSTKSGLWFLGSFILRVIVTVGGFYLLTSGDWKRAVACALGFTAMRMIFVRRALKEER